MLRWVVKNIDNISIDQHTKSCWLDEYALARLNSFRSAQRRRQFIASRILLDELIINEFPEQKKIKWRFLKSLNKPKLQTNLPISTIECSISHSGNWVAVALSSVPVGIDVEEIGLKRNFIKLAESLFSDVEFANFRESGDLETIFATNWVLKEAWIKKNAVSLRTKTAKYINATKIEAGRSNAASVCTSDFAIAVCFDQGQENLASSYLIEDKVEYWDVQFNCSTDRKVLEQSA